MSFERGQFGCRDRHTQKEKPSEEEGRDRGGASMGQGMTTMASKPPEARGEIRNRFFTVSKGINSVVILILDY